MRLIELMPDEERALAERARVSGRDLAGYVYQVLKQHLRTPEPVSSPEESAYGADLILKDLIDWEAIEPCAREVEGKDVPSIQEVRQRLAKIPGSMAQAVIKEREVARAGSMGGRNSSV
jgi:hypothetical protein